MALVDFDKQFIYLHIYKTGGTSVRTALMEAVPTCMEIGTSHTLLRDLPVSEGFLDSSFKFCFVRNPFDWMVSMYSYIMQYESHILHKIVKEHSFKWFCWYYLEVLYGSEKTDYGNGYHKPYDFIVDKEGVDRMDFIGKVENMEQDFKTVCARLQIDCKLPHLNRTNRQKDYRIYYDKHSKAFIEAHFKNELRYFNYKF